LIDVLGPGPVAFDTALFIYLIEEHPVYASVVRPAFVAADAGDLEIVTSAVTLLEVLVVPYRAGNLPLAQRYETILTRSRGVRLLELERPLLRTAAMIRARFGVRTPDALQLAAALSARCTAFVTNDRRLPEAPGTRIIQVDDHI
jgi:predicted nucleic acid-binding protein